MTGTLQPIVLLADSQLLFWRQQGRLFLASIRDRLAADRPRAAYVGASNGDQPEYFELFRSAMAAVGVEDCRLIPSHLGSADREYFETADLVLLAGGDPRRGWKVFEANGLKEKVVERYRAGALLMGVSAGAMQLGLYLVGEGDETPVEALKLVPFLVDAHDEPDWRRLHRILLTVGAPVRGLGIPSGGGAFVYPDLSLESIRFPLVEITP